MGLEGERVIVQGRKREDRDMVKRFDISFTTG
jgi:hypothetical protein